MSRTGFLFVCAVLAIACPCKNSCAVKQQARPAAQEPAQAALPDAKAMDSLDAAYTQANYLAGDRLLRAEALETAVSLNPGDAKQEELFYNLKQEISPVFREAMEILEPALSKSPEHPAAPKLYLLLGKLKRLYEPRGDGQGIKEFEEYAKARPDEFFYNEVGGNYLYRGWHFEELMRRFPSSPLVTDAAYEMTKLSIGGECEGWVTCYIERGFFQVHRFLEEYPNSKYSAEAVHRANQAFRSVLWGPVWKTEWMNVPDPNQAVEGYDPAELKTIVQRYEDVSQKLPPLLRASAYETIAYYRARFGETERARQLYTFIVREVPGYENMAQVRQALAALP